MGSSFRGLNVVLFHKAASVERIILAEGTKTSFSSGHNTDDGWEVEYTVIEEVPAASDKTASRDGAPAEWPDIAHAATLHIDLDSVYVHIIEVVMFKSSPNKVHRHRWQKRDLDDSPF
jgi:hypothetical protein